MITQRHLSVLAISAGFALILAACGGSDSATTATGEEDVVTSDAEVSAEPSSSDSEGDLQDDIDEMAENLEATQAAQGGGTATLVVGDQEWVFESVLCAFGEEQIGQEGAVFNLSSIQDGMQMYASIDSFGHSVSLNDIEDFENPSVSLDAFGGEFILIDGKTVTAEAEFTDGTSESFDTVTGTFTASCP